MRLRLGLVSLAGSSVLASLLAGCLSDPDSASRRSLSFDSLRFESPIAAHEDSATIEVGFLVGTSACWGLESIGVERSGSTLLVSGVAVDPSGGRDPCAAVVVWAVDTLTLPPLEPGTYLLRACSLLDTLVVEEAPAASARRAVLRGDVDRFAGTCGRVGAGELDVGLASLPDSLPSGRLLVWGDEWTPEEVAADTCDSLPPGRFDFFVSVRRLVPAPT